MTPHKVSVGPRAREYQGLRQDARYLRSIVHRLRPSILPSLQAVERWMQDDKPRLAPQAAAAIAIEAHAQRKKDAAK